MLDTRYYKVAGITLRVDSELVIEKHTFAEKFRLFEVSGPGADNVHLVHRFDLAGDGSGILAGSCSMSRMAASQRGLSPSPSA